MEMIIEAALENDLIQTTLFDTFQAHFANTHEVLRQMISIVRSGRLGLPGPRAHAQVNHRRASTSCAATLSTRRCLSIYCTKDSLPSLLLRWPYPSTF